jgi:glycosyltransferase involved in cell wall biosynthesis
VIPELTKPGTSLPEVSVVIPTRDRWARLAVTLGSALAQEDVDLEVVVVDDGSQDATPGRLAEIDDPRLVVLRNAAPRGVAAARNRAIAAARAPWVAFLDDDDLWSPRTLRTQLDAARSRPGAVMGYCDTVVLDGHLDVVSTIVPPEPGELVPLLRGWNMIGGPSCVMADTETIRRLGGFDERLSVLADWDLWIRLAAAGPTVHCPASLVGYVVHDGGMFTRHPDAVSADFRYLTAKYVNGSRSSRGTTVELRLAIALAYGHARGGRRLRAARSALAAALRHRDPMAAAIGVALLGGQDFALAMRRLVLRRRPPPPPPWLEREVVRARSLSRSPGGPLADAIQARAAVGVRKVEVTPRERGIGPRNG